MRASSSSSLRSGGEGSAGPGTASSLPRRPRGAHPAGLILVDDLHLSPEVGVTGGLNGVMSKLVVLRVPVLSQRQELPMQELGRAISNDDQEAGRLGGSSPGCGRPAAMRVYSRYSRFSAHSARVPSFLHRTLRISLRAFLW